MFAAEDLNILGGLFAEAKDKLIGVVLPELPPTLSEKRPKTIGAAKAATASEAAATPNPAVGLGIGSLKK